MEPFLNPEMLYYLKNQQPMIESTIIGPDEIAIESPFLVIYWKIL